MPASRIVASPLTPDCKAAGTRAIASGSSCDESDKRIVESEQQQQAIERIVDRRQVVVLLLVQHHEAVVLFDQMVVGPKRGEEKEDETGAGENHHWPNCEEQQRTPKQAAAVLPFGAIEVGAREGAEDMWRINQDGPERHHRNQRQDAVDVKNKQQVTGNYRADEPDQIIARADDPAQRRLRVVARVNCVD